MLKYRTTLILFIIALSGLILCDIFRAVSIWWYIGIVIVLTALLALGSVHMRMGFYLTSYCSGNPARKEVVFSFDDGPDNEVTARVLDLLNLNSIKAVFFVIGGKVIKNPDLIKRMNAEGHIIGGHSFSHHFFFDLFTARRMKNELQETSDAIRNLTAIKTRIFRPPYGVTNPRVASTLRSMGLLSIGWSLKSKDTMITGENLLLNRLKKRVRPGDIILFHDTLPVVPEVLPKFIEFLRDEKYEIIGLDQMLNIKLYE